MRRKKNERGNTLINAQANILIYNCKKRSNLMTMIMRMTMTKLLIYNLYKKTPLQSLLDLNLKNNLTVRIDLLKINKERDAKERSIKILRYYHARKYKMKRIY